MTNLTFGDRLVQYPLPGRHEYSYSNLRSMNLFYGEEVPFIIKSGLHPPGELTYSGTGMQIGNRMLTADRVREVLDTAKMPIIVRIGRTSEFLVGKGFLARYTDQNNIDILFAATVKGETRLKNITEIEEVTFYVSKDIHLPVNKGIATIMRDLIRDHKGDVVFANDIRSYISKRIQIPKFSTLKERKEYINSLVDYSFESMKKTGRA